MNGIDNSQPIRELTDRQVFEVLLDRSGTSTRVDGAYEYRWLVTRKDNSAPLGVNGMSEICVKFSPGGTFLSWETMDY